MLILVTVGDSILVKTVIDCPPRYKDGSPVTASARHKFLYPEDGAFSLLVSAAEEGDVGKYECCAANKGGQVSSSARLVITGTRGRDG